jgi:2-polyprenyl-3-methyl-5-hydroxy-6-metoxy-1,4-benzoquinol methylase
MEVRRFTELLAMEKVGRLLDVGCADGQFAEHLARLGWTSFGIDISQTNAYMATQRGVMTTVGDLGSSLPFGSNIFDAIVAKNVIEHLLDTRLLLTECWRVLQPKGCLILSTANLASLSNRLRLLFGLYPGWMDYQLENSVGHVRYYISSILRQQLASVGFRIEREVGTTLVVPLLARFLPQDRVRLLILLGRMFPSLSPHLVIKARKL